MQDERTRGAPFATTRAAYGSSSWALIDASVIVTAPRAGLSPRSADVAQRERMERTTARTVRATKTRRRIPTSGNEDDPDAPGPARTWVSVGGAVTLGLAVGRVSGAAVGVALGATEAAAVGVGVGVGVAVGVGVGPTLAPLVIFAEQITRLPPPLAEPLH